jgi:acetyltransferase-like isoleucine patch superfamily enzyme
VGDLLIRRLVLWFWVRVTAVVTRSAGHYVDTIERVLGIGGVVGLLSRIEGSSAVTLLLAKGATIGDNVRILKGLTLHNVDLDFSNLRIGDRVHIGKDVFMDLAAPIEIRNRVTVSIRCTLLRHMDAGDSLSEVAAGSKRRAGMELCEDAYLGAGATVLAGVRIGRGAVVGAGVVVTRQIQENARVVGVPAAPVCLAKEHSATLKMTGHTGSC